MLERREQLNGLDYSPSMGEEHRPEDVTEVRTTIMDHTNASSGQLRFLATSVFVVSTVYILPLSITNYKAPHISYFLLMHSVSSRARHIYSNFLRRDST